MLVGILAIVLGLTAALISWRGIQRRKGATASWFDPFLMPLAIIVIVTCSVVFAFKR
jgi:hypothetical protein